MGNFNKKTTIIGTALGVGGAFDKGRKTDRAAAFGAAMGASLASGEKWTLEDSFRLNASLNAPDDEKED